MTYNETVLDHFANPRNAGKMRNPDAKGETGNPADGDRIIIYIRIYDNRLKEVSFQTYGCPAAIAASSMLTELATGKTIEEARSITNEDVAVALGGLPHQKLLCSNIAADALHEALDEYGASVKEQQADDCATPVEQMLDETVNLNCQKNMEAAARQYVSQLTSQQVQRYLRQIIMPEISGRGQETLLQTHVMVRMPSVEWGDMMLAYLAAIGVGQITCVLDDIESGNDILEHVQDLNPDLKLDVMRGSKPNFNAKHHTLNAFMLIGPTDYIETHQQRINQASKVMLSKMKGESDNLTPEILVEVKPWQGTLHMRVHGYQQMNKENSENVEVKAMPMEKQTLGEGLSASFGGILAVIELVKSRLSIGQQPGKPFAYDLINMKFGEEVGAVEEGFAIDSKLHQRLARGKVLLIGTGGLGSPSAFALVKAGIGTLGLVDHDQVDLSNLNRQILHTTSRIGMPKVESGAKTLRLLNPKTTVHTYQERMTEKNVDRLLKEYDLLLDGLDNLSSRYVANKAAVSAGKPFIQAGVLTFYGQSTSILPGEGPCYECIFPQSENSGNAPTCEEAGVLGAVPGLMGVIQATEVIKQIYGIKPSLQNKYLMVDTLETDFIAIEFTHRPGCPICSTT